MKSRASQADRRTLGQSMVEYLVACAVVTALIAVPIDGHPCVLDLLLNAIRIAYQRFSAALSLPQ